MLDFDWCFMFAILVFSKLIMHCRIDFAILTVIFCFHVKQTIWDTEHLPFLILLCGLVWICFFFFFPPLKIGLFAAVWVIVFTCCSIYFKEMGKVIANVA